jgi:hypothetical protein
VPTEPISDVAETSAWADEHTVTFRFLSAGVAGHWLPRLLFLQPGNFFRMRFDSRERWFSYA